jgi:predicted nucleic acid-binding protein
VERGLTAGSLVAPAARHGCDRVLTVDERHFRALRTTREQAFTLIPADA